MLIMNSDPPAASRIYLFQEPLLFVTPCYLHVTITRLCYILLYIVKYSAPVHMA